MTFKEFGENADIKITVVIEVNDDVALKTEVLSIDSAIAALGTAERHNYIQNKLKEQYEDLPEPIEDESRGFND